MCLDRQMRFAVVDESAAKTTISDRIHRVRGNPIQARKSGGGGPRRSGGRGGGGPRKGGGGKAASGAEPSAADLDKDLDTYMSIRGGEKQ
jgi:hypothetical protein